MMASLADDGVDRVKVLPGLSAFVAFLALGVAAVMLLPGIGDNLPHPGRTAQARYAAAGAGVLMATAVYVCLVAIRLKLDNYWIATTMVFGAGLVMVKFVLSPNAFERASGVGLVEFIVSGLIVVPFYWAGPAVIHTFAKRHGDGWSIGSRLGIAVGLAAVAVAVRFTVAAVLGTASDYASDFVGEGLIMPAVVIVASLAMMGSFHRAGSHKRAILNVILALVTAHHLLWVIYMYGLFA